MAEKQKRQYVNYTFYKVDPLWRRLPEEEKDRGKLEFAEVIERYSNKIMDEHIELGHEYPSVKINTTYSFGLDDQEFIVAFETDKPEDFMEVVMKMREQEGRKYTLRDTPIFTCVKKSIGAILNMVA